MAKFSYGRYLHERTWGVIHGSLATAIQRAGGTSALSRYCGANASTISRWRNRERLPTYEQAYLIERHTGVSRKGMRPDVDWTQFSDRKLREIWEAQQSDRLFQAYQERKASARALPDSEQNKWRQSISSIMPKPQSFKTKR